MEHDWPVRNRRNSKKHGKCFYKLIQDEINRTKRTLYTMTITMYVKRSLKGNKTSYLKKSRRSLRADNPSYLSSPDRKDRTLLGQNNVPPV